MTVLRRGILLLAVFLAGHIALFAESKPLELKWTELSAMISGNRVEIALEGGAEVSGEAIAVREDALVLEVTGSSGSKQYPKGSATIPQNTILLIKLHRSRGAWGRTMGTVVGVIGGLGIGTYAGVHMDSVGAGVAVVVGVASAAAVAGYYAGRSLDRRVTVIRIIP